MVATSRAPTDLRPRCGAGIAIADVRFVSKCQLQHRHTPSHSAPAHYVISLSADDVHNFDITMIQRYCCCICKALEPYVRVRSVLIRCLLCCVVFFVSKNECCALLDYYAFKNEVSSFPPPGLLHSVVLTSMNKCHACFHDSTLVPTRHIT